MMTHYNGKTKIGMGLFVGQAMLISGAAGKLISSALHHGVQDASLHAQWPDWALPVLGGALVGVMSSLYIASSQKAVDFLANAGDALGALFQPETNDNPHHFKDYSKPVTPKHRAAKAAGRLNS